MTRWFGSSGIRGPFHKINPSFCMKFGIAVGKTLKTDTTAYIASDIRKTSDLLKSSIMSGYSSESGSIIDIGLAPTPVLAYLSYCKENLGIMITASHNPPSNNGIKLFLNGTECKEAIEFRIEETLEKEFVKLDRSLISKDSWKDVGLISHERNEVHFDSYFKFILKSIKIDNLAMKVVLDCANNVPNLTSPQILKNIGVKSLITINNDMDAFFLGRPSEPSAENLNTLKQTVIRENADIGIAHDGDGDRFAIIDEKGHFVNPTAIISFFADHFNYSNQNRNTVVLSSDCTKQTKDIVEKKGGIVIQSKIGRNREFVDNNNILFLAEPNKLIFPEFSKWIDGLFPVLKLLKLSQLNPISEIMKEYDKRKVLRKAVAITDKERPRIFELVKNLPENWSKDIRDISELDGMKLFFKDNSIVLIRFSGTESKIKFYIESPSIKKNIAILGKLVKEFDFDSTGFDC